MLLLLPKNVLKLPMVYHVSPKTNVTLKPRTLFCVSTEVLCPVPPHEGMGVSGLSTRPWTSIGSLFGSWLQCPSCVSGVERNHQPCPWWGWDHVDTQGRQNGFFCTSLVPSFWDRSLSKNPIISCLYEVFIIAQHVLGLQLHRWVTTPYTAQGLSLTSTTGMLRKYHCTPLSFIFLLWNLLC